MKVANVWVNRYEKGKLLGFADVMFSLREDGNGCVTIKGFKIFRDDKNGGVQVVVPAKQDKDNEWRPFVKINIEDPDGKALMDEITSAVETKYRSNSSEKHTKKNTEDNGFGIEDGAIPF